MSHPHHHHASPSPSDFLSPDPEPEPEDDRPNFQRAPTLTPADEFDMSHIPVRHAVGSIHATLARNLHKSAYQPDSPIRGPSPLPHGVYMSWWEIKHVQWSVMFLLIMHLVVVPFILVLCYYLDFIQVFVPAIFAMMISAVTVMMIYRHMKRLNHSWSFNRHHTDQFILSVLKDWRWEWYQAIVSLLGCALYIVYTYKLYFILYDMTNPINGYYRLEMDVETFCQCEYFLMVCFAFDYLFRYYSTPIHRRYRFLIDFYNLLDMAAFSAVVYGSIVARGFEPQDTIYNAYLFQGPFRFLRLRRAIKSLDEPRSTRLGNEYRLGPWVISRLSARVVVVAFKSVLYILCAASLILAVETPCSAIFPPVNGVEQCHGSDLRQFHNCVYLTVVTLSTVGYGDIVCTTILGRMLIVCIILLALLIVPRELNSIMEAATAAKEQALEEERQKEAAIQAVIQQQLQQKSDVKEAKTILASAVSTDQSNSQHVPMVTPVSVAVTPLDRDAVLQWAELQLLRYRSSSELRAMCELLHIEPIPESHQIGSILARHLLWPDAITETAVSTSSVPLITAASIFAPTSTSASTPTTAPGHAQRRANTSSTSKS